MTDVIEHDDIAANVDTTVDSQAVETTTEAPQSDAPMSLDDALAKAIEAHRPTEEGTTGALPAIPGDNKAAAAPAPALQPGQVLDSVTGRVLEPIKAPGGLPPALREKWTVLPREFQQFWADRERDMATNLQSSSTARKLEREFRDIVGPHEAALTALGTNAMAHTKELFDLSRGLHTGDPVQKAHIFFNLINHFKPDAQALGALFTGQPVPVRPIQPAPPPRDTNALVEQELQRREQERAAQESTSAIEAFAADTSHEFFADVRTEMGAIINAGLVDQTKGAAEQLKEAYGLAVSRRADIQQVIAARATQSPAPAPAAPSTTRAVKSVKPSLAAGKSVNSKPKKLMSIDEALDAAIAQHSA